MYYTHNTLTQQFAQERRNFTSHVVTALTCAETAGIVVYKKRLSADSYVFKRAYIFLPIHVDRDERRLLGTNGIVFIDWD